jgi:hypothetical protein
MSESRDSTSPSQSNPDASSADQPNQSRPEHPFPADLGRILGASKAPIIFPGNDDHTIISAGDVEQAFKASISELALELGKRRGPKVFSQNAINELAVQQASFLQDVGFEAINTARRNQADVVSRADVQNAEATLRSRGPTFPARLLEPVGGLIAGAGLSQLYAVLSAPRNSPPSVLAYSIATISTVIGIALLCFGLARR